MDKIINKNTSLLQKEKSLIREYEQLEKSCQISETVIKCQVQINQNRERQKEITDRLLVIRSKLLLENKEEKIK